jgi:hypothetical protein
MTSDSGEAEVDPTSAMAAKAVGAIAGEANKATPGVVARMLGPAADEIGAALGRYTHRQLTNVGAVSEAASRKRRRAAPEDDGPVGLRAAMRIVEDSSYAEGEVVAEYLSGVLASAKAEGANDDRAVSWSALVSRLSSDQLRLHFVLYTCFRHLLLGRHGENARALCTAACYIPLPMVMKAMEWMNEEDVARFYDAFYGLLREGLIEADQWVYGEIDTLQEADRAAQFPGAGIVASPSRPGLGLWLWGMGYGASAVTEAVRPDLDMQPAVLDLDIELDQVSLVSDLPRKAEG